MAADVSLNSLNWPDTHSQGLLDRLAICHPFVMLIALSLLLSHFGTRVVFHLPLLYWLNLAAVVVIVLYVEHFYSPTILFTWFWSLLIVVYE